jgi:hypothetical protein
MTVLSNVAINSVASLVSSIRGQPEAQHFSLYDRLFIEHTIASERAEIDKSRKDFRPHR